MYKRAISRSERVAHKVRLPFSQQLTIVLLLIWHLGATQHVVDMLQCDFQGLMAMASRMVIGFMLTTADPRERELVDRIMQATNTLARQYGYNMLVDVRDDPDRFGVDPHLP